MGELIRRSGVTMAAAVPTVLSDLLHAPTRIPAVFDTARAVG
jgi:hypothetical protein